MQQRQTSRSLPIRYESYARRTMEHLTQRQLGNMLEQGAISSSVAHRRQTLIAVAERAKRSKTHTPGSRQRLRVFRAYLESEQNNDEVEVTGEMFCEVLMRWMRCESGTRHALSWQVA